MIKNLKQVPKSQILKSIVRGAVKASLIALGAYLIVEAPQMHHSYIRGSVGPSVVRITNLDENSGGTGFAVQAPSGKTYILTNAHICLGIDKPMIVNFKQNRKVPLRVIEVSRETDLCLVESVGNLKPLKLASNLEIGDNIGIVGHPSLMDLTLTRGDFIEYTDVGMPVPQQFCDRAKEEGGPFFEIDNPFFPCVGIVKHAAQTTVVILPGNSGSPAVNMFGNLVGVAFAGRSDVGWGVIVPVEDVRNFLKPY